MPLPLSLTCLEIGLWVSLGGYFYVGMVGHQIHLNRFQVQEVIDIPHLLSMVDWLGHTIYATYSSVKISSAFRCRNDLTLMKLASLELRSISNLVSPFFPSSGQTGS